MQRRPLQVNLQVFFDSGLNCLRILCLGPEIEGHQNQLQCTRADPFATWLLRHLFSPFWINEIFAKETPRT